MLASDHPARQVAEHGKAMKKLGKFIETIEQLGTKVDRAVKLVTIQPTIHKTSGLLKHSFSKEYGTCLTMRCERFGGGHQQAVKKNREDIELEQRQVGSREKCSQMTAGE